MFQLFKKDTSVTDDIQLRNLSCWYYLRKIMIMTNALGRNMICCIKESKRNLKIRKSFMEILAKPIFMTTDLGRDPEG